MRILCLNCQRGYNPSLKPFLKEALDSGKYDFLLFQEATSDVLDVVARESSYAVERGRSGRVEDAEACVVYRNRFKLSEPVSLSFAEGSISAWGFVGGSFSALGEDIVIGSLHLRSGFHPFVRNKQLRSIRKELVSRFGADRPIVFGGDFNFGFPGEIFAARRTLSPGFVSVTKRLGPTLDSRYTEDAPSLANKLSSLLRRFGLGVKLGTDHVFAAGAALSGRNISSEKLSDRVSDHSPIEISISSMKFSVPHSDRKKALIVVDMQKGFLGEVDRSVSVNIQRMLEKVSYDLCIETIFHAEKGSLWDKQDNWTFKLEPTIPELEIILRKKSAVLVTKTTKSAFGGDKDLIALFREKGIEEVHIVGVDTNDCVLATAYDSFDAGFFTYVIEECAGSSAGKEIHECALKILRNTDLTNHSNLIRDCKFI